MNTARFTLSAILLVAGIISISLTSRTYAQTLILARPFQHAGLIFSSPLSFEHPPALIKPITLEFGTIDEIDVQPTTQQQVAVETIVTPTPSPDSLTDTHPDYTTGLVTPTPTLLPTSTPLPQTSPPETPTTTPQQHVVTSPANPGGLNADVLFGMVNTYRATKGLPAFQKDDKSCSLAALSCSGSR